MAYNDDIILVTRAIINDLDSPYTYSDSRLLQLIYAGATLLSFEINISDYTIDLNAQTITPTPTNDIQMLIVLKTACMVAGAEAKTYAMESISIKDGPSSIDTGSSAKQMADRYKLICEQLDKAKMNYLANKVVVGRAVIGPLVYDISDGVLGGIYDIQ